MPELPEVESLRQMLWRSLSGRRFRRVTIRDSRLRRAVSGELAAAVAGRRIERISRRAKYLLLELAGDLVLLVHLGMSGSLTHRRANFAVTEFDSRHDHVEFELDDGSRLVYNDPRRFGLIKAVPRAELSSLSELKSLGPEPLSPQFSPAYLWRATRGRTAPIKNLLMDQRVVAGVGNIYASEILFRAAIRPTRRAGRITRSEAARIVTATEEILRQAIGCGGTTFRSYRDSRGQPGRFASLLRVYNREGKPCVKCAAIIRAVVLGGRSTYYCPRCQR